MAVNPVSALANAAAGASAGTGSTGSAATIAKNFDTFLQLLTTQLEQQISLNQQMTTLIALQKTTQTSAALGFLGSTVTVNGATAKLKNAQAAWSLNPAQAAEATITIRDRTGQVVFTDSRTLNAGQNTYSWNGRDASGRLLPDGDYTISATGKAANGQLVAIPSEIEGVVDGVDLTQDPPVLRIGQQSFTLDNIKRVVRSGG
jgi:flagellar basal-body rod modification protein FlgD